MHVNEYSHQKHLNTPLLLSMKRRTIVKFCTQALNRATSNGSTKHRSVDGLFFFSVRPQQYVHETENDMKSVDRYLALDSVCVVLLPRHHFCPIVVARVGKDAPTNPEHAFTLTCSELCSAECLVHRLCPCTSNVFACTKLVLSHTQQVTNVPKHIPKVT